VTRTHGKIVILKRQLTNPSKYDSVQIFRRTVADQNYIHDGSYKRMKFGKCQVRFSSESFIFSTAILRPRKEVSRMVGMTALETSYCLPAVIFPSGILWFTPSSLKRLYLITNVRVKRKVGQLDRNEEEHTEGVRVKAREMWRGSLHGTTFRGLNVVKKI
jgi:hypothetical protein